MEYGVPGLLTIMLLGGAVFVIALGATAVFVTLAIQKHNSERDEREEPPTD